jgi:8-oxo-dGTP diphosphatase
MRNTYFAVATKAIIYNKGKFLILLKSEIEDVNPNTYDIPGGRINFGEKLEDGLKREVKEETNLDIKVVGTVDAWSFVKDDQMQLVGITYVAIAASDKIKLSAEHSSYEWLTYKDVTNSKALPEWLVNSIKVAYNILKNQGVQA